MTKALLRLAAVRDTKQARELRGDTEQFIASSSALVLRILSHVSRKTLCEHVNGLRPAGWLTEKSITKHWFQSVRTCPHSWATGRNNTISGNSFKES